VGGKTATSQQNLTIPPAVLAQYQSVVNSSNQVAKTPFQQYGGEFVAPVNAEQSQGIAGTNAAANEAQPGYSAAQSTLGTAQQNTNGVNNAALGLAAGSAQQVNAQPLTAQDIQQYMNPYVQDVAGSTAALLGQNNAQAQSGALGTAIQSGAFGGDRTGIAAANLEQQQNLANANIYSGILSQGYQNAQGVAQQQQGVSLAAGQANRAALANAGQEIASIGQTAYGEGANTAAEQGSLASGAQTAGLQGANAQIAAGTVQQQTQQAQDQAEYNQFLQQESYPFQVQSWLAGISEGTGALSGSDTTTTQPGGFFSDRRLKHGIKKIGKTYDGQHIYSYKMHGDDRTHIGLMAQEVEKKRPDAVGVDPGSHYKMVDYGAATEKAANRGHFYEGGVVPMRVARASGGPSIVDASDLNAILQAQAQMYAPMASSTGVYGGQGGTIPRGGSSRVPPPSGVAPHLVTAEGGLRAQPTGLQNLAASLGTADKARDLYSDIRKPVRHTTTDTTPGGLAPDWSNPGANYDGSATETTAPGQARGGRTGYDDGGGVDYSDLVNAHGAMYNQGQQHKTEDIPSDGGSHTLTVASGSPTPPTSGANNVNQGLGLAQKGYQTYKHFNPPTSGVSAPGLGAPSDLSSQGVAASAPAADSGTISGLASTAPADAGATTAAGAAGSGAAADVAGTAAAGAAADAGGTAAAEAAAAIAAEYAAADVGAAALVAAKRGGRIGYDSGGMPYSSPDGSLDIPDQGAGAAKLQTAGPLVKRPTGLQTLETLGTEQGAQGAISGMFSNQGYRSGGVAGRRGYADGGGPDDDEITPPADDAPSAGVSGPSWWQRNKGNVLPVLQGIAAMGTAPTKHLGVALAAGLGAGAGAYVPTQEGLADTAQTQARTRGVDIQNQMAQTNLDTYRAALKQAQTAPQSGSSPPRKPLFSLDPAQIASNDRSRYFVPSNYTPEELQAKTQGNVVSGMSKNPAFSSNPQFVHDQRIQRLEVANHNDAQDQYDKFYNVATAPNAGDQAYTNAKMVVPEDAVQIAKAVGLDPNRENQWSSDDRAKANAAALEYATHKTESLFQWTGDKSDVLAGAKVNGRTSQPLIGRLAQTLTPEQASGRQVALAHAETLGAGLPQTIGSIINGQGASQPPAPGAAPAAPPATARPPIRNSPAAPKAPPAAAYSSGDPDLDKALADPAFRPQALPRVTDQVSLQAAKDKQKAISDANTGLQSDSESAAQSSAAALQYALAAKQIMDSKGVPTTGFFGPLAKQITSIVNGSNASNYEELAKDLGNLAVQSSKGNFPHATEKENMVQFEQLSPSTAHTPKALADLLDQNIRTNQWTLDTANRAKDYVKYGNDPQNFFKWNQKHFSRSDAVNTPPPKGPPTISSQAEYDALPSGPYIHNGRQGSKP
jgi:hypothetical protein